MKSKRCLKIYLLIPVGIFLTLSYFLYVHTSLVNSHSDIDSKAYIQRAACFAQTNSFALPGDHQNKAPYFALGYPFFIGIIYKVFGENNKHVIWVQVLLALLSGFLIGVITRRAFGKVSGYIAALLFSVNLGFLAFAQFLLTEIVLVFFLIIFFERFTAYLANPDHPLHALCCAGLALGLSIIIKPAALYYVFLLIPVMYFVTPRAFKSCVLFALCFYLPVVSYMSYNKMVFDSFAICSLDQVNIYFWFFPHVLAEKNHTTSDIEREKLIKLGGNHPAFTPVKELFYQELQKNPGLFVYAWLKNVFKTCAGLFTTNLKVLVDPNVHGGDISYFRLPGSGIHKIWAYITAGTDLLWVHAVGFIEFLWSIVRYFLCVLGLVELLRQKKYHMLYFVTSYLFYFSMITGHDGCARFRMLFEFVVIMLAAAGAKILWQLVQQHKNRE